jgi:hypothetical protein
MTKTDQIRDKRELLTKEAAAQIQELVKDKKGYLDFQSNAFMEGDGDTIHGFNCSSMFAVGFSSEYSLGKLDLTDTILLLECIEEAISIEPEEEPQNYYSIQNESGSERGIIATGENFNKRLKAALDSYHDSDSSLLNEEEERDSCKNYLYVYHFFGDEHLEQIVLTPVTIY